MRNGGMDGPKGAVRILASQFILMTTSSVKKLLRKKGFKSRRKGSDSVFFYWSDKPGTIQPHQTTTKVQNNGGGVMFWGCITADGPGHGKVTLRPTYASHRHDNLHKWAE
ncbi:hypothetical protein INT46_004303 [Mucor plumbeus]|uniref:Uncharacterized protein n=1 Tax=Mucor plumbeus TaxID=97098 RepID=A0A8H7QD13_9FUNG|nr:hypothetical protein INT46_004303 [Mucor plumbeus]